jgi:hypothetical protein
MLYSEVEAIKKTTIRKLVYLDISAKTITFSSIRDAMADRRSRLENMSMYENNMVKLERRIMELESSLSESHSAMQKLKLETDDHIRRALKPYEQNSEYLRQNIPDMLAQTLMFRSLGMDEKQGIQRTITDWMSKNDKLREDLRTQIAELNAENKALKSKIKTQDTTFDPAEINISDTPAKIGGT